MTDHRSKPHPHVGDIWRWNDKVSRNAQGIELKIASVEGSFGGKFRVRYTGQTGGTIDDDNLKWTADFVRNGTPPPKAVPSQAALRDAAYLNAKASRWMEGVKAGWARADEFEERKKEQEKLSQIRQETKQLEQRTTDDLIAIGRKVLSDTTAEADKVSELRNRVEAFWTKHSPHKLPKLDETMASFKGREDCLAEELAAAEAKMAKLAITIRSAAGPIVPPLHRGALNAAQKAKLAEPGARQDEADMPA